MTRLNRIMYLNVMLSDSNIIDALNNIHPLDKKYKL